MKVIGVGNLKGGVNITYSMKNDGVDYEKTELLSDETINYVESIKDSVEEDWAVFYFAEN